RRLGRKPESPPPRRTARATYGDRGARRTLRRSRARVAHSSVVGRAQAVPRRAGAAPSQGRVVKVGVVRLIGAALLLALPASAQDSAKSTARAHVPYGVGERLEYQVKFGKLSVGSGAMEVLPMDTVRGHDVWHTLFNLKGGIPFYRVNDKYESWF